MNICLLNGIKGNLIKHNYYKIHILRNIFKVQLIKIKFMGASKVVKALIITIITILVLGVIYFIAHHKNNPTENLDEITKDCIALCKNVSKSIDLSNGPCISDIYSDLWHHNDWVCDVAHYPRQNIDNLPENQCQQYRQGKAHHFVEVDENCNLIRYY